MLRTRSGGPASEVSSRARYFFVSQSRARISLTKEHVDARAKRSGIHIRISSE
jgi:hypothetical protein